MYKKTVAKSHSFFCGTTFRLFAQIFVDALCCRFSGAHCQDNGSCSGHRVTACIYAGDRCFAGFFVCNNSTPRFRFQFGCGVFDHRAVSYTHLFRPSLPTTTGVQNFVRFTKKTGVRFLVTGDILAFFNTG